MNTNAGKYLLVVLALIGIGVMGYLVNLHFAPNGSAFCNLGEGLSCDEVNQSEYAKVFGIPLSVLGVLYFVGILLLTLFRYNEKTLTLIALASIAFMGPSLYLTYLEFNVINNICVFCEASKVVIVLVIIVSLSFIRSVDGLSKKIVGAVVGAVFLTGITFLAHNAGGVPSGSYDTFAQCVTESGLKMYGSQGCSFCARQRALFGDSFQFIDEIECDPRFPEHDPQPELCIEKDIAHTPTWIMEDDQGVIIEKFEPGVLSLEELSAVTGCDLINDLEQ